MRIDWPYISIAPTMVCPICVPLWSSILSIGYLDFNNFPKAELLLELLETPDLIKFEEKNADLLRKFTIQPFLAVEYLKRINQ